MCGQRPTPEQLLTTVQHRLSDAVRSSLHRAHAIYSETVDDTRAESWVSFHLVTSPSSHARVEIVVVDDRFGFIANDASLYLDRIAWGDDAVAWIRTCVEVLDALLASDLRIRVRKTLFGRRTGAVWIPARNGGWNGDLVACRGRGEEKVFPRPWFDTSS